MKEAVELIVPQIQEYQTKLGLNEAELIQVYMICITVENIMRTCPASQKLRMAGVSLWLAIKTKQVELGIEVTDES